MARSVPPWVGASDDSPIPPRVKLRVFERAGGSCEACLRKLGPVDRWQADHDIALINGGRNAESNLKCLCEGCHRYKTRRDVALKAKTARIRQFHLGIKAPSRPLLSRNTFRRGPGNARDIWGDLDE